MTTTNPNNPTIKKIKKTSSCHHYKVHHHQGNHQNIGLERDLGRPIEKDRSETATYSFGQIMDPTRSLTPKAL